MSQRPEGDHRPSPPSPISADSPNPAMAVHAPLPHLHQSGFLSAAYGFEGDRNTELPSLSRCSSYTNASVRTSSPTLPTSLSSILNPESTSISSTHSPDEHSSPRRRKMPHGVPRMPSLPALSPLSFGQRQIGDAPSVPRLNHPTEDRAQRPMLTPRSPLQRSISHMNLRSSVTSAPQGYVPVRRSPLDRLPAPTPGLHPLHELATSQLTSPAGSRAGISPAGLRYEHPYGSRHDSAGTSPVLSRSSRSQPEQTPRSLISQQGHSASHGQASTRPYSQGYYGRHDYPAHEESRQGASRASASGPGSSSQSSYQVMSVQTSTGMMRLPVDVALASKIANDRRRRNAGASARFRSRRKQRDMVAADTIQNLEQHTRALTEVIEFYKAERDHYRAVLQSQPEIKDEPFDRPSSPQMPSLRPVTSAASSTADSGHSPAPETGRAGASSSHGYGSN